MYCAYCDMNSHPRFTCKHAYKHQKEADKHRCTLCSAFHAPFCCSRAQINGGSGKLNWSRIEYKRAKNESREPDLRWGADAAHPHVDFPTLGSQSPSEDQQPMCAAAAMMHRSSRGASSSWQGGCPPVDEQQEWAPSKAPQHVILANPGYKIEANIWNLDVKASALRPGPLASFLRHCNTVDSPPVPSYLRGGPQLSQQMTLSFSAVKLLWRTFENFKGMQKGFNSKRHVLVYGLTVFRIRLWMRQRESRIGSQVDW